jgi:hypothetical protein
MLSAKFFFVNTHTHTHTNEESEIGWVPVAPSRCLFEMWMDGYLVMDQDEIFIDSSLEGSPFAKIDGLGGWGWGWGSNERKISLPFHLIFIQVFMM